MDTGQVAFVAKFMRKVRQAEGGCWPWLGGHNTGGYPRYQCGWENYAHRVMWTINFGPIPSGMSVCHTCDNPGCVRPSHLWLGTPKDNLQDAVRKGRTAHPHRTGEAGPNHKLTWESVRQIRALVEGGSRHRQVAAEFGVTQATISHIVTRKTWVE
jgi:hypothetical protein